MNLQDFGWNKHFERYNKQVNKKNYSVGRVISEIKNHLRLMTTEGELPAKCAGKMFFDAQGKDDLPVVGDWVLFRINRSPEVTGRIYTILPRTSMFSRKVPGKVVREQPVAANIDTAFLVSGLDDNYNLRRLERYLSITWESGAMPVILLNKEDLCQRASECLLEVESVAPGVPIHVISALNSLGLDQLDQYLQPGKTVAMLGSSGVGKSTLLNTLMNSDVQKTKKMGVTGKGMHTTRLRELFVLPNGSMLIDTPGMREIQLWNIDEGFDDTFSDLFEFANSCKFSDCTHQHEPGCAVKAAVDAGKLEKKRYENYMGMRAEQRSLELLQDKKAMAAKQKSLGKLIKEVKKVSKKKF